MPVTQFYNKVSQRQISARSINFVTLVKSREQKEMLSLFARSDFKDPSFVVSENWTV